MTKKNIKFFTASVITCAKYAKEVLGNDLSGLAGGGCGGSGSGCGCSGGSSSLMTIEDLYDIFTEMDGYDTAHIQYGFPKKYEPYYSQCPEAYQDLSEDNLSQDCPMLLLQP